MLGVLIKLGLCTHTMPNNHYMQHLHDAIVSPESDSQTCMTIGRKSKWAMYGTCQQDGCKSMTWKDLQSCWECLDINLLYTHTMPNNHYCSTYMMPYPHLMAKHCLTSRQKIVVFPDLRHETCQHVAVKVWWMDLQSCWECSSTCYTPIQCQTTTIVAPTWCHTPTWWPNIAWESAENRDFSWSEAWNLPTCGCKSMVEGLTIMLGVFINLLYTHTMPNNHYCSTYMMPYPHLMAKHCLRVGRKSRFFLWSEAWNLPTCGCKSMVEGLTIMLGVFINLLYTHTMPNNHYCSTYMLPYPHLMAKHCLRVGRKSRFFSWSEAWNLPTCGCKSMVEGLTIMLGVFINLLYTHTMPNNHYCSTYMMPYPHLMAKHCLTVGRKSRFLPDLSMKPANMWL